MRDNARGIARGAIGRPANAFREQPWLLGLVDAADPRLGSSGGEDRSVAVLYCTQTLAVLDPPPQDFTVREEMLGPPPPTRPHFVRG
jgi:hypothetical protein